MKCPSCNKFAALEMQDPEVNSVELELTEGENGIVENATVSVEVRILRNSECCGDEMKEYTFNTDADVSDEIVEKMNEIRKTDPEAGFEAEEDGCDSTEEGGHRYKKSFYGYTLTVKIVHGDQQLGTMEVTENVQASSMDELN